MPSNNPGSLSILGDLNRHVIRTPEGIEFRLELAGPAQRFLAWVIDFAVVIMMVMTLQYLAILGFLIGPDFFNAVLMLLYFTTMLGYGIVMEWFFQGRTIGKFVMKLRVLDVQGLRMHFSQVAVRNLLRLVDSIPLLYLLGGIVMMLSPARQRLGDIAANTVVVRERKPVVPDLDQILTDKYNSFRQYPHLEARLRQRISPTEIAILIQALLRREQLADDDRLSLYRALADRLRELTPFPEEATAGLSDEQYMRNALESIYGKQAAEKHKETPSLEG